jgi:hypothetical protein
MKALKNKNNRLYKGYKEAIWNDKYMNLIQG